MKKHIELILCAVVFGFIAFGTYFVFSELVIRQDTKLIDNFKGAFLGAFFAFIGVRIADGLNKIYERHAKNNKALIMLEHELNDRGGIIHDDIYTADTFLSFVKELESNPSMPLVYSGVIHEIPINRESILDLINIDLINDLASYNIRTRKMNDSIGSFNSAYNQIKTSFLDKQANDATYVHNVIGMKDTAILFKGFFDELLNNTKVLVAKIRLLHKDMPFVSRIILLTFKKNYPKGFLEKVENELSKLNSEIEQVGKESKDRIDRVISKGT
jgi:hypothetical protein